jgi:MFS family permease
VESRRERLLAATAAVRAVLRNREIGRLEVAWLLANAATYAYLVVTLVAAYQGGGAFAAGLLAVVKYVPPALVSPFAGVPATRWRADRVLLLVNAARAAGMLLTAGAIALDGPLWLLFVLVAIEAAFAGLTRPLTMSLLPWLARTPGELVASNITSSAAEGLGTLIGPAGAGALLAACGSIGAAAATAILMVVAAITVASIQVPLIRTTGPEGSLRVGATAGLRVFAGVPAIRLVLIGFWLQSMVRGLLTVLLVVAAIERLGMGQPGVGTLQAAIGAGGFIGAVVALSLTNRAQFGPTFGLSLAMWGLPIAVLGLVTSPAAAVAMLAIVGMSNAILDVTGFTILQRACPNDARVALMGLVESPAAALVALGGLVASWLVATLGNQAALVLSGALLPLMAVAIVPGLRRAEQAILGREETARLLRADPLLSVLSLSVIEELAAVLRPVEFADGEDLIREGEPGDAYLIVAAGQVEVSQGGRLLHRLGPGSGVGEIALLRDIPRTATVRAAGPVEAYLLEREAFLAAVTGHHAARVAADAIADDRLARSPGRPSL